MVDRSKKSVWGPALWLYLHTAAEYCDDPEAFSSFVTCLASTLPCPECRSHLKEYTARVPPASFIKDRPSATAYVRELHDHVNVLTGKKRPPQEQQHEAPVTSPVKPRAPPPAQAQLRRGSGLQSSAPSGIRAATGGAPPPASWRTAQPQRLGPRAPRGAAVAAPRLRRH